MPKTDDRTFEQALSELEHCVRQLDAGELPLEDALQVFDDGVRLQRECQELLDASEQRIVDLSARMEPRGLSNPKAEDT